jgi:hypothetical protein
MEAAEVLKKTSREGTDFAGGDLHPILVKQRRADLLPLAMMEKPL